MGADIKLLEDKVREVVQRLQKVSAERARLEGEVRELEKKLAQAHRGSSGKVSTALAEALREAIRELREA